MADKPVTTDISAGSQYKASHINANFAILETAIEGCLGRGGTSENPNSMQGDLDMNLNRVRNLPIPQYLDEPIRYGDIGYPIELTEITGEAIVVDDIADLKALVGAAVNQAVMVKGYYSPGDGGGGPLRVWKTGTYVDNGGSIIVPTGGDGSGAWVFAGDGQSESFTVKIPSDYPTLQAAIDNLYAVRMKPGEFITLLIETGHMIASQLILVATDASQFIISSVDPVVTIQRSALTTLFIGRYPAFCADKQTKFPIINTLFNMDSSGPATLRDAFFIYGGSSIYINSHKGCTNAGERGLHVTNNSFAYARLSNFSGATTRGVRVANGSYACIRDSNITNCGTEAIAIASSFVDAHGCDVSGSAVGLESYDSVIRFENGVAVGCGKGLIAYSSQVSARFANLSNATGRCVEVREASNVSLRSANMSGAGEHGLFVSSSAVNAANANLDNCVGSGVIAYASTVDVDNASILNAGAYGVYAQAASTINAQGSNTTGAVTTGFLNLEGSFIDTHDATGVRGRTTNTLSRHGVIWNSV